MFKTRRENQALLKENTALLDDAIEYKQTIAITKESNERLFRNIQDITEKAKKISKERDTLKSMVREQANADLLLNALKSVGLIKEEVEEGSKTDYQLQAAGLQARASSSQQMNTDLGTGFSGISFSYLGPQSTQF